MNRYIRCGPCIACLALLAACAGTPDRFYTLSALPNDGRIAAASPGVHVLLGVTIPVLVDRSEMVVDIAGNGMRVLDHERWGGPLSDQVSQTLARDIEKRRPDVLVAGRAFDQTAAPPVTVRVDIVRMSVRRGGRAGLAAQWHVVDPGAGTDEIGSDFFEVPLQGDDYSSIATAYSETLSMLADKLAARIRGRVPVQPQG